MYQNGQVYSYEYDGRGSVSELVNALGQTQIKYSYGAYGETVSTVIGWNNPVTNPYRYNAERIDDIAGVPAFQYLRARYLNPYTANFLTQDSYLGSLLTPLSQNRYLYAQGSPLNFVDPSGHDSYFYYIKEWKGEAEYDRTKLAKELYEGDESKVHMIEVSSAEDLTENWNNMGIVNNETVSIESVIIDVHGNPQLLGFGKFKTGEAFKLNDFKTLESKSMDELILYACNAGHLDYQETNIAANFAQKVDGAPVLASDGTVYSYYDLVAWTGIVSTPYKSKADKDFKYWVNKPNPENSEKRKKIVVGKYIRRLMEKFRSQTQGKRILHYWKCLLF